MSSSSMQDPKDTEMYIAQLINETNASQTRISQLERMMGEAQRMAGKFHEDNELLRKDLAKTKEKVSTLSAPPPPEPRRPAIKPQKPEPFHGDRNEDVDGFLVTLERYLRLSGLYEEQWVDYAASFLRHQADKWFRVQLSTQGDNSIFARSYYEFRRQLLQQFKPLNSVMAARDRITQLRQTGSASAYTHRFLELKLEITDMSEAEAKDRYMRGLKPHVLQKVRVENPPTFNETIRMAQQFDEAVYNCRRTVGYFPRNPNAMELDLMEDEEDVEIKSDEESGEEEEEVTLNAMRQRGRPYKRYVRRPSKKPRSSRMTNDETTKCRQQGLCFKCRKAGHRIRECPLWKNLKAQAQ